MAREGIDCPICLHVDKTGTVIVDPDDISRVTCQQCGNSWFRYDFLKHYPHNISIEVEKAWEIEAAAHAGPENALKPIVVEQSIKVDVEEIVSLEDLQQKAFNQFSESGMREILSKLSRFSHVLGKADGPDEPT